MFKYRPFPLLLFSCFVLMSCNSSRKTISDWKSESPDFVEVYMGPSLSYHSEVILLLKDGTLVSLPRHKRSFWNTRTMKIEPALTDSIFDLALSKDYLALPETLDDECNLTYEVEIEPFYQSPFFQSEKQIIQKGYAHYLTDQPTRKVTIRYSSTEKTVSFEQCFPYDDSELHKTYSNALSDSSTTTFPDIQDQNENIKRIRKTFDSIWKTVFDLKDQAK